MFLNHSLKKADYIFVFMYLCVYMFLYIFMYVCIALRVNGLKISKL